MKTLDTKQTGELIKTYRKMQKYTQFQLAEIAGIDEKQLGKIERGVHYPSVPTFLKIIKALNINVNEFYTDCTDNTYDSKLFYLIRNASAKKLDLVCKIFEVVHDVA